MQVEYIPKKGIMLISCAFLTFALLIANVPIQVNELHSQSSEDGHGAEWKTGQTKVPPPTQPLSSYDVTIKAYCLRELKYVSVKIAMDGTPTSHSTNHTFKGLADTHTFTVPSEDAEHHWFKHWSTGETSRTITVSSGGTYTAYYHFPMQTTPPANSAGKMPPLSLGMECLD